METHGRPPAWTDDPVGYFVPRLGVIRSPDIGNFGTTLSVESMTGTAQLDYRTLGAKAGNKAGYVPTVAGHVLHLDPETRQPLGREHNGLFGKGAYGHILSSYAAGLTFLPATGKRVTLSHALPPADGSSGLRPPSLMDSFAVWEQFAPPVPLAQAVRTAEPKALAIPFVDAVAVVKVPADQSPGRIRADAQGCARILLDDEHGRRRAVLLLSGDFLYGEPSFFAFHRFKTDLLTLQSQLMERVTAHVWDRLAGVDLTNASDEMRDETLSEASDTWLLWRQENGLGDEVFDAFAPKELEMYFADMAGLMPYYWEIPVVRSLLESDCQGIAGALPGVPPTDAPPLGPQGTGGPTPAAPATESPAITAPAAPPATPGPKGGASHKPPAADAHPRPSEPAPPIHRPVPPTPREGVAATAPAPKPPKPSAFPPPTPLTFAGALLFSFVTLIVASGVTSFGKSRDWNLSASARHVRDVIEGQASTGPWYGLQHLIYILANLVRVVAMLAVIAAAVAFIVSSLQSLQGRGGTGSRRMAP